MKIVVLGYGELAESVVLGILKSRHELVGVMRWKREKPNPFSSFFRDVFLPETLLTLIRSNNIKEIKAKYANNKKFIKQIKKLNPDVIIVASWGEILKKELFDLPKVAFINCHPSMLPAHRGSNPYASVIKQGEIKTGVTFHLMNEEIDAGDILLQEKIDISQEDTGESLKRKCAFKAKDMVQKLLEGLEKGEIIPQKQNEVEASYFPVIDEEDVTINWHKPADFIHNQIRAIAPRLSCYAQYGNDFLMIKSSKIISLHKPCEFPGTILKNNSVGLLISTGDPQKAILAENVEVYGFLSKLWSGGYIKNRIKTGSSFKKK